MRIARSWKSGAWLIVALWAAGGQIPRALAAQEGFREPRINGFRLDWCYSWGKECGQPTADEFCRRQGFKSALRFEQVRGVGPTQVISTGEICSVPACAAFLYITCSQVPRPAEREVVETAAPAAAGTRAAQPSEKPWKYEILARNWVITPKADGHLLDFLSIDVGGFRTARLFVHVTPAGGEADQEKLTKAARLRVTGFHNAPNGSHEYAQAEIPMRVAPQISGWVEIPVIGHNLRIVVAGDQLPNLPLKANCTLYLLK